MLKSKPRVVIVNYGMGNLFSVMHMCFHVGLDAVITESKEELEAADGIILPGVGAFGDAMENLGRLGLVEPLQKAILTQNKPFFGICLGLQLLMDESHEFGYHKGLGIIPGAVIRFRDQIKDKNAKPVKIPQVGWNQIYPASDKNTWADSLLSGVHENEFMYFVHSYHIVPKQSENQLSMTRYGDFEFCSSISKGMVFGCQFHPERSGGQGIKIYQNFLRQVVEQKEKNENSIRSN